MILVLSDGRQAAALPRMGIILRALRGLPGPATLRMILVLRVPEGSRLLRMILILRSLGIVDSTNVLVTYPKPTSLRY